MLYPGPVVNQVPPSLKLHPLTLSRPFLSWVVLKSFQSIWSQGILAGELVVYEDCNNTLKILYFLS
jgi:hypothetical protein